ncbi:MAG: hypothetical protein WCL10_15660 [Novosphingobium sp.]|jgi:hypothetical protein|uniref:hypothetical protein n=1 Tax=Novosphingobium sp. TaxID=1874826 RepID=UPI00301644AA
MADRVSIKCWPIRAFANAAGIGLLALASAAPAAAQIVSHNGDSDLSAINSGDISLHGNVTNPTVSGGTDNSAGNLSAQGASSSYSINDANLDAKGEPVGNYTASVTGVRLSGTNSGSVNVRATISGGSFAGSNNSQSVSATGLSNVISIKTTSAK